MKELIRDIEMAEQFLNGTLTEKEKNALARRLDQDKEYNLLLQDMDKLVEGIKYTGSKTSVEEKINRLKALAQNEEQDVTQVKPESKLININTWRLQSNWVRYAIAASVVLFAAFIFAITKPFNFSRDKDLYAAYFEPFDSPGSGLTRGNDNRLTAKVEAYEAYDAKNYITAVPLFEKSLIENDEAIVHLCLANAHMALNEFDKAEIVFQHMLKEHTDLVTQTKWYLALTYLKQNKLERTKATLWEISNSSTYGEKARKVLKELD